MVRIVMIAVLLAFAPSIAQADLRATTERPSFSANDLAVIELMPRSQPSSPRIRGWCVASSMLWKKNAPPAPRHPRPARTARQPTPTSTAWAAPPPKPHTICSSS